MGKQTNDLDFDITCEVANNDSLRALKGRPRLDSIAKLEASEARLKGLYAQRRNAVVADAAAECVAHEDRLKAATDDVEASRQAEKLAASIDADVETLVGKFAKLTALTAPCYERAKKAALDAHGLPALIDKIDVNRKWVATAVGQERHEAATEQAWLNSQYTLMLADVSSLLESIASIRPTSPQTADAVANAFQRIRAAWSGEAPPARRLTLEAAHARKTAALVSHVAVLELKAPALLLPNERGNLVKVPRS